MYCKGKQNGSPTVKVAVSIRPIQFLFSSFSFIPGSPKALENSSRFIDFHT
jgi:hypothetical protein